MAPPSRKPDGSRFGVGDLVRIRPGELLPARSPGHWRGTIDGAEGVVSDITRDGANGELQFHVALNRNTLDRMPEDYLRDCREQRWDPGMMVLGEEQLEHHDWSTLDPPVW